MVLILGNDPKITHLIWLSLRIEGAETFEASLNVLSDALFHSLQPDIVIIDTVRIDENLFTLVRNLRQQRTEIGVILCTSIYPQGRDPRLQSAGVDEIIGKPFSMATLRRQVCRLRERLSTRKPHQPLTHPKAFAPTIVSTGDRHVQ